MLFESVCQCSGWRWRGSCEARPRRWGGDSAQGLDLPGEKLNGHCNFGISIKCWKAPFNMFGFICLFCSIYVLADIATSPCFSLELIPQSWRPAFCKITIFGFGLRDSHPLYWHQGWKILSTSVPSHASPTGGSSTSESSLPSPPPPSSSPSPSSSLGIISTMHPCTFLFWPNDGVAIQFLQEK